ncbi:MAG: phospholipase D-like domain-containing protein, partial [Solirubrobacterales bacterium]
DAYYAVEAALKSAADSARAQGKTPGNFRVQFSSQNYQITHQKSILIDTSDHNGNALTKDQMGTNSKVLVSTGNLQSYGWGGYEYYNKNTKKWVITNEDYLTNPAKSCLDGNSKPISPCADEWAARDFAIEVTESELKARIAAVFAADQTCAKWEDTQVYQDLLGSNLADTWANGTLIAAGTTYPTGGKPDFYAGFGPNKLLQPDPDKPGQIKPQGNSRKRQLDLIASAKETLIVYNEEMDDPDMINALADRARNNVDVRVVMSAPFDKATGKPKPSNELPVIQKDGTVKPGTGNYKFSYLISNGVKVKFFCSGNPNTPCPDNLQDSLYIHAKAIVADGVNAFLGSENFGYASLNYNRELGLMLSNSTDSKVWTAPSIVSVGGVAAIMTAFSTDWNSSDAVPYTAQTPLDLPFAGYPKDAPYPQPPAGTPFTDDSGAPEFNLACVPPQGGNPYAPALAPRKLPPQT